MSNEDINANSITARKVRADNVAATNFGGADGSGATINASSINLGGYIIEAGDKGLYVTTPDGIRTKIELIDFRQTPVPETVPLLVPAGGNASVPQTGVQGGPALPGGSSLPGPP